MRHYRALALCGALALAGCGSINIPNPFTGKPITSQDVQNAAVAACGFLPTVETVTGIISAAAGAGAAVVSAEQIASQICSAVLPAKSARLGSIPHPTVRGVLVHGRFVR